MAPARTELHTEGRYRKRGDERDGRVKWSGTSNIPRSVLIQLFMSASAASPTPESPKPDRIRPSFKFVLKFEGGVPSESPPRSPDPRNGSGVLLYVPQEWGERLESNSEDPTFVTPPKRGIVGLQGAESFHGAFTVV